MFGPRSVVGVLVLIGIGVGTSGSAARADSVRDAIEAGNRAFVAAFLRGDAKAVSQLYSEDARVIAPGAPAASGRDAIAAFWQKSIDSGVKDVRLDTLDVASSGDLASETGEVLLVAKDGSQSQARYVVVWKRVAGRWLLYRDIWNAE
jgi:uncharacterized protein (TIGR02246 family)